MQDTTKVDNKYGFPLELFTQTSEDGPLVTLKSCSGAAHIYLWFTPEQAKLLAAELVAQALKFQASPELQSSDESSQNL
jgi:hypothetical protein